MAGRDARTLVGQVPDLPTPMPEWEYTFRMKRVLVCAVAIASGAWGQAPPNPDSQYRLGPDSMAQEGVPQGEIRGPFTLPSQVFPGTQHTYFVYVPAQYDPSVPASLMIFNDGQAFMAPEGDLRAQNVMDNLIYRREIPVMIGVFINPGRRPDQPERPRAIGATAPPIARLSTTRWAMRIRA